MTFHSIDTALSKSLGLFDEALEREVFERLCLSTFNLTRAYLVRNPTKPDEYKNPIVTVAWESWKYRALAAVALYKEAHLNNS